MNLEYYLASGSLLGVTAGLSPGPLLTLVVSETLKHNKKEGIKIALAPLATDSPIIVLTLLLVNKLSDVKMALGLLSLVGACYLLYLGWENLKAQPIMVEEDPVKPSSLSKGIIANFLNPHPYLFWASIGTPIIIEGFEIDIFHAVAFFVGFYVFIIGSKVAVAVIVEKMRHVLESRAYLMTLKGLGLLLIVFALKLLFDAWKYCA